MAELEELSNDDGLSFDSLPVEITEYILSYIDVQERIKLQSVCKLWRQMVWSSVSDLSIQIRTPDLVAKELISILPQCGKTLKLLQLAHHEPAGLSYHISRAGIETLAKYCPNLERIHLSELRLPDSCLGMLANGCVKLKVVCLHNCCGFSEDGLADFFERCQAIEALDISLPPSFTGKCLSSVGARLKILYLEHLVFGGRPIALHNLTCRCEYLEELHLSCNVESAGLITCFEKYAQTLKVLHIGIYVRIANWKNILNILHNLEVFSCANVDGQLLTILAESCLKLRELRVRGMLGKTSHAGVVPANYLPSLKVLDISHCTMTQNGILLFFMLALKGQLEEVYANGVSVNAVVYYQIANGCPNLRILQVIQNKYVTNSFVSTFWHNVTKSHITKLCVKGTNVTTDVPKYDSLELDFLSEGRTLELPTFFRIPSASLRLFI